MINSAALINPAKSHGGVIVSAVASRDLEQAQKYAKQYDIPNAYGSYNELLSEPGIDAVYISLPNGMHGSTCLLCSLYAPYPTSPRCMDSMGEEGAQRRQTRPPREALHRQRRRGPLPRPARRREAAHPRRSVPLAVPRTSSAHPLASTLVPVPIPTYTYTYYLHTSSKSDQATYAPPTQPAAHTLKATLSSGKYGPIQRTSARMTSPQGSIPRTDVRWQLALAGGSLMDMTYVLSATRYFLGASASGVGVSVGTPREVAEATARPAPHDAQVDEAMEATLLFDVGPGGRTVESRVYSDMWREHVWGVVPRIWETPSIEIETEHAVIYFYKCVLLCLYVCWSVRGQG